MAVQWRARVGDRIVAQAQDRGAFDLQKLVAFLAAGSHVYTDIRSADSRWFCVEDFYWDGQHLVQQFLIPFIVEGTAGPVLTDIADETVRRRGRPRKYATKAEYLAANREQTRLRQAQQRRQAGVRPRRKYATEEERRRALRAWKQRNPEKVQQQGAQRRAQYRNVFQHARFLRTNETASEPPAIGGLACASRSWIVRGLFQQQWTDKLDRRYYPTDLDVRVLRQLD